MGIIWAFGAAVFALMIGECYLYFLYRQTTVRYVKLEEWAEDWLKRLEQKGEADSEHIAKIAVKVAELEELIPRGRNGELVRNQLLLQQMNDEMEKSLKMEKDFNEGLQNILKYGEPKQRGE